MKRTSFRLNCLQRDDNKCVICKNSATVVHHLLERRLWKKEDGGYNIDNGVSLCQKHHIEAEKTLISVEDLRKFADIKNIITPEHLYPDLIYDKWGNEILKNGDRIKGELFDDKNVQKILKPYLHLFVKYIKYPRTYHLPWSKGLTKDDRQMETTNNFKRKEVIVTLKLDGENTTMYNDYIHSRSLEFVPHVSRNFIKKLHAKISYNIPETMRICGENVYAKHSIFYKNLSNYFFVFSIWEGNICLNWKDTLEYIELLNLTHVPVLYQGIYNEEKIKSLYKTRFQENEMEGYVIRIVDSFHKKDFNKYVGKFVRKNHICAHNFWMKQKIIFNHTKENVWKNS